MASIIRAASAAATDRFRFIDEAAGAVFCNQCFSKKNGDGFAAIQWTTGCSFPEAVEKVADYLGISPTKKKGGGNKKPTADPAKDLEWQPWSNPLADFFCAAKPGVTVASLKAQGCRMARYKTLTVIVWPIIGPDLDTEKPVGYILMDYSARPIIPKYDRHGNIVEKVDKKVTFGSKSGFIGVDAVTAIKQVGLVDVVWKAEGVTDLCAFWAAIPENVRGRHVVISTSCGANQNPKWMGDYLSKFNRNIVHDADKPGQAGAAKWEVMVAGRIAEGKEVRNIPLPYEIQDTHGKDSRDFWAEGNTFGAMLALAEKTEPTVVEADNTNEGNTKPDSLLPEVLLPKGDQTISDAGEQLGQLLAAKHTHFNRGEAVVRIGRDVQGHALISPVEPSRLASDFECVADLKKEYASGEDLVVKPAICSQSEAKLILDSKSFREQLPRLNLISRTPVLIEHNQELVVVTGFHVPSGIWAEGDEPPDMTLAEAKENLRQLLSDFQFATSSDESRALASFITPAMIFGKMLPGRAPVDLGEADQSQTGKGYRNKLVAAVYGCSPSAVTQKDKGIGSLEECFDHALIQGKIFISIDNVRGKLNSPRIESFLTEDTFCARCAYSPHIEIDPKRVYVMFTSNKADITRDFANRSSCVRLQKQPRGYQFRSFPEGDLLGHVAANQAVYLGGVFRVIKQWHSAGKPRTRETRHDFRPWAQILDWIVQNLFEAAPLLDGHQETLHRMTCPAMNWLRDVGLLVVKANRDGRWLRVAEILDLIADEPDIEIPGTPTKQAPETDAERESALKQIGRRMKACFEGSDVVEIGRIGVERRNHRDWKSRDCHSYCFTCQPASKYSADTHDNSSNVTTGQPNDESQTESKPSNGPPDPPVTDPAINPRVSPDSPDGVQHSRANKGESTTSDSVYGANNEFIKGSRDIRGIQNDFEELVFE